MKKEDNFGRLLLLLLITFGLCWAMYYLPDKLLGLPIKRVDMLSDLRVKAEAFSMDSLRLQLEQPDTIQIDTAAMRDSISKTTGIDSTGLALRDSLYRVMYAEQGADSLGVRIEDYSVGHVGLKRFFEALRSSRERPVRIAFLGDSFIEGDIVTADLREKLQESYGGSGVGFVPFSSPIAQFRGTIRHVFEGWQTLDVKNARSVAEDLKDKFFVSGYLCIPDEGASVRYEGVSFRKHLWSVPECRLIFMNRGQTCIQVTINDTIQQEYRPESSEEIQQIRIKQRSIHSIECRFTGTEGFIGYGIVFGGPDGARVDNYSIRGNSGLALFATNGRVNSTLGAMFDYDLIVLEYGLNVLTADVLHYDSYRKAFVRVINYMKRCFPDAAVLVMGICDRSMQNNGVFETMPSVDGMIAAQRAAAEETGVDVVPTGLVRVSAQRHETVYANGDRTQYLDLTFVCRLAEGGRAVPRVADDESLEVGWFAPDALPQPLAASTVERLAALAAWREAGAGRALFSFGE